jgi:hypothetical protein
LCNLSPFVFERNRTAKKPIVVSEITWPLHLSFTVCYPLIATALNSTSNGKIMALT